MKDVEGARQDSDHYLQLDQNETDLLAAVCEAGFKKVVVLINSGSPMELAFLTHPDYYAYQDKIDAAIWMGFPRCIRRECAGTHPERRSESVRAHG